MYGEGGAPGTVLVHNLKITSHVLHRDVPFGWCQVRFFELSLSIFRGLGEGRGGAPGVVPLQNPEVTSRKACLKETFFGQAAVAQTPSLSARKQRPNQTLAANILVFPKSLSKRHAMHNNLLTNILSEVGTTIALLRGGWPDGSRVVTQTFRTLRCSMRKNTVKPRR